MKIKELDKKKILEAFDETEGQGLDEINYQLINVTVDKETNIYVTYRYIPLLCIY